MLKKLKSKLSLFYPYLIFAIVSVLLLYFAKAFRDDTFLNHPQFGLGSKYFEALFHIAKKSINYYFFLIADLFFIISITIIIKVLFDYLKPPKQIFPKRKFFKTLLIVLSILSVIFNLVENIIYILGLNGNYNYLVELGKNISENALISLFIYYFTIVKLIPNWKKIADVLKSSFLSIIILMIIGLGLTFMPQGASLIVHLFNQTDSVLIFNLIASIFLVNVLALFVSHFPIYLNFAFNKIIVKNKNIKDKHSDHIYWYLNNNIWGLGIITYRFKGESSTWKRYMRHSLGVLTYAVWFYVIIKAFELYQLTHVNAFSATVIVTIGFLGIYAYLFYKVNKIYLLFKDALANNTKELEERYNEIKKWSNRYFISLMLTITYAFIYFIVIYRYGIGWSYIGLSMVLALMILNTATYILFRLTKGMWKYVWGNKEDFININKNDHQEVLASNLDLLEEFKASSTSRFYIFKKLKKFLLWFNSNVFYVKTLRKLGIASFLILILAYILQCTEKVTDLSALIILLAFIINVYALITIAIKHILFYNNFKPSTFHIYNNSIALEHSKALKLTRVFLTRSFIIVLGLITTSYFLSNLDNLHELNFVKSENAMTVDDFEIGLENHISTMRSKRMVKIASFGGGLKSNLWNLLVLTEINKSLRKDSLTILDKCISLSGVSGGSVGLGNFLVLDYLFRDKPDKMDTIIQKIGESNILSIDMTGILISDFINNHFFQWGSKNKKDRAFYAMNDYINLIASNESDKLELYKSQQTLWYDMYKKHGYLPALIINTASTGLKPGVAFSLDTKGKTVFPGYILLADEDKDLRYYDAISTSNRFPVMSPAAQVENKGFFLDGGYFENSGLLTSKYFNDYLKKNSVLDSTTIMTINIQNSRGNYIRKFIDSFKIELDSIDFTTNAKAIISGITNIDKLPNVLTKTQKWYSDSSNQFCSVYMPHWITVKDIEKTIGGKIKLTDYIYNGIKDNNKKIIDAFNECMIDYKKTGIVEPPLARTLSLPAVRYEQAMIKYHIDCRKEVKRIVNFVGNRK